MVEAEYILTVLDTVIEHLRMFNKKQKDSIWNGLIIKILEYTKPLHYIDLAIDLADPLNNKSTHRIAATIIQTMSQDIPESGFSAVL